MKTFQRDAVARFAFTLGRRMAWLVVACLGLHGPAAWAQGAAPAAADKASEAVDDGGALYDAASLATHWGDFAEAERLFKATRERQRRTSDGRPEATVLRRGFENGLDPGNGLRVLQAEQTLAMTTQWVQQHPRSPLAHTLHMSALTQLAWAHRGNDYANTVAKQSWEQFRRAIERAAAHAGQHADVLMSDSLGARSVLLLGTALDWDSRRSNALYEQVAERFPDDDSLHFVQMTNLLPKWGGSARLVDQHIESVVRRTQATRGLSLYATLYTAAAEEQFRQALFSDSMARWPRVDQGYADLTARYPHPKHFNAWAWMACQAQDRQRLLELLDKLGPEPLLDRWGNNARQTYDGCKAWAQKL